MRRLACSTVLACLITRGHRDLTVPQATGEGNLRLREQLSATNFSASRFYKSGSRQTKSKAALIPSFTGKAKVKSLPSSLVVLNMLTFWKKAWRPVVVSVNNGAPVEVGCL